MGGSWEYQPSVLVVVLHTEMVPVAWSMGFRNLIIPGTVMPIAGQPFDMARNNGCLAALQNGFDYVFHLDSDVVPPKDAILRLMAHHLPVVSGLYCRRSPPHAVPVAQNSQGWLRDLPDPSKKGYNPLVEVDVVGAGCLLIDCNVLRQMPPGRPGLPFFDWRVHLNGVEGAGVPPDTCRSEDFVFNLRLKRELGIKTYLDTSVRCRHIGLAQAELGSFLPCEVAVNT